MTRIRTQLLLGVCLLAALAARPAAQQPASRSAEHGRPAARDLPRRDQLRRGRRRGLRSPGPLRQRPHARRLPGAGGGRPAGRLQLQPRQHPDRTRRAAPVRAQSHRAGRGDRTPPRSRVACTSSCSTTSRRRPFARRWSGGGAAVHRAGDGRERRGRCCLHERPRRSRTGVHQQQAAAPGQRGPVSWAGSCARPRSSAWTSTSASGASPGRTADRGAGSTTHSIMERGRDARSSLDALRNISEYVGGIHGRRKAIVYLSEGIDYDIYDFNNREATTIQEGDAGRHRVGHAGEREHLRDRPARPHRARRGVDRGNRRVPGDPQSNLSMQSFQDELRLSQMQPAQPLGGHRRLRGDKQQRFQQGLGAGRRRQQLLLRPRLLPEER